MIDFTPRCLAMPISSMSHADIERACRIILKNFPEIPALPTLPNVAYMKGAFDVAEGMPCLKVDEEKQKIYFDTSRNFTEELIQFYAKYFANDLDSMAITRRCNPGFIDMLEVLKNQPPPEMKLIKFSTIGPISFMIRNVDENNKPIFYNEALREAIIKALAMKVRWKEKRIHEFIPGVQTILLIAEPLMGMYGSAFVSMKREEVLTCLTEVIQATSGLSCIHCCANTDWPLLMESGASAISFDAYEYADRVALYPREIQSYIEKGGIMAWGIVPTNDDRIVRESPETLLKKLEASMELMVRRGINKELLVMRSLVTPSCGTGTMTVPTAEMVYLYTNVVAKAMQRRYFS